MTDKPLSALSGRVPCTTAGCQDRAEKYCSSEGEGSYPYCGECYRVHPYSPISCSS